MKGNKVRAECPGVNVIPMIGAASATLLSAAPSKADEIIVIEPAAVDSAVGSIIEAVKVQATGRN